MFNFLNKKKNKRDNVEKIEIEDEEDNDDIFGDGSGKNKAPKMNSALPAGSGRSIDIGRYRDPEGLTVRKMKIGLWITANRNNFKMIFVFLLAVLIVFSWGLYLSVFGRLVFFDMKRDREMMAGFMSGDRTAYDYVINNEARPLEAKSPEALETAPGKYDFLAQISNSNQNYYADFKYSFRYNGIESRTENGFILPGEEKYVFLLGEKADQFGGRLELIIKQLEWHRIDSRKFGDWGLFAREHLDISTDDVEYVPAQSSSLSENISINTLYFNTTNNTAYNYWEVSYLALLFDNNRVVGVNRYILNRLLSGQTRDVGITWPQDIGRVSRTVIIPEIDITKNSVYIDYDGGHGEIK
jgi:hypothetical protein